MNLLNQEGLGVDTNVLEFCLSCLVNSANAECTLPLSKLSYVGCLTQELSNTVLRPSCVASRVQWIP